MLTTKALIITDPVSIVLPRFTDPFKTHSSQSSPTNDGNDDPTAQEAEEEYGSSDVTSDESTDHSPAPTEESSSPTIAIASTPRSNKTSNDVTATAASIDLREQRLYHHQQGAPQELHKDDISPMKLLLPSCWPCFVPITLERSVQDDLSVSMLDLYERLLPTRDAYKRRRNFVTKVEAILNSEWKGQDIRANLFGSSENDLGTSTSDVDICLTTSWAGLKCVKTLAGVLKKHGMQRVHTVPRAKVPIVKMWDPVYQLACDMNVNNPLALHNTRMIKTYVAIDPRVRPLAMLIKYWTRQRALNNAADGGTLSTYTWTCMIINFLQMREPPILPVLHQMGGRGVYDNDQTTTLVDGLDISFYTDIDSLKDFGKRNHESLGGLLFAFFRRFAYEFDYETQVVSVRHGRYLRKREKGWHEGPNKRMFCIEEPFNVHRNLGNSADDASVYGLQAEFRRAVHILLETESLEALCAKYFPPAAAAIPVYVEYPQQQQQQQQKHPFLLRFPLLQTS
ncbi:hypothetical protein BDB00DRAFT_787304 [Zychaea mexicana]|uniref:uncharacterized protein n=1 Tax=Zychaea mexicana TaxID=64656 RepID=UPI0022FEC80E|nr:uncharacterized protein BDB00DRAFT_787304 [Zychaea mexicana]KAI9494262.1 hypothetical protein BDB00DRAFT_787304 [Zychaea mexicana]